MFYPPDYVWSDLHLSTTVLIESKVDPTLWIHSGFILPDSRGATFVLQGVVAEEILVSQKDMLKKKKRSIFKLDYKTDF